jgi:uncharacterized membrane protein YedE/YeeE
MKGRLLPLAAGLLFAIGLGISGMTQPAKVSGFLDFFGHWDPSLAFVMGGAVGVYFVAYRLVRRLRGPGFAALPSMPIDARLVGGAALFGVGWGLSGFCPGPALASVGAGAHAALWFVPAMLAGMALEHALKRARSRSESDQ